MTDIVAYVYAIKKPEGLERWQAGGGVRSTEPLLLMVSRNNPVGVTELFRAIFQPFLCKKGLICCSF